MARLLFHPLVLLLLAALAIGIWAWAKRVDLRVRLTRLPTAREWTIINAAVQALRWLLRIRL